MIKLKKLINEDSDWNISDKKRFRSELGSKLEDALQTTVEEWKKILKESVSELIGKDFSSVDPEIRYYKEAQSPIKEIHTIEFFYGIQKGFTGEVRIYCTLENGKKLSGLIPIEFDYDASTKKVKIDL